MELSEWAGGWQLYGFCTQLQLYNFKSIIIKVFVMHFFINQQLSFNSKIITLNADAYDVNLKMEAR